MFKFRISGIGQGGQVTIDSDDPEEPKAFKTSGLVIHYSSMVRSVE